MAVISWFASETLISLLQGDGAVGSTCRVGFNLSGHVDAEAAMAGLADCLWNCGCFIAGVHVLVVHRRLAAVDDVEEVSGFGASGKIALKELRVLGTGRAGIRIAAERRQRASEAVG